jgi:hypothetical protein
MTLSLACGRCGKLSTLTNRDPRGKGDWLQKCEHCGWWCFAHEVAGVTLDTTETDTGGRALTYKTDLEKQ